MKGVLTGSPQDYYRTYKFDLFLPITLVLQNFRILIEIIISGVIAE